MKRCMFLLSVSVLCIGGQCETASFPFPSSNRIAGEWEMGIDFCLVTQESRQCETIPVFCLELTGTQVLKMLACPPERAQGSGFQGDYVPESSRIQVNGDAVVIEFTTLGDALGITGWDTLRIIFTIEGEFDGADKINGTMEQTLDLDSLDSLPPGVVPDDILGGFGPAGTMSSAKYRISMTRQ